MNNIAIIDADLIERPKHRFPNLACMKISGYYKELGYNVILKADYKQLDEFDKVFISKVFTDTPINKEILQLPNVEYGGTGFYYDKAPRLDNVIEHHMPDYHLYDDWVNSILSASGEKKHRELKYYLDYSIGFMTRGCFRQCEFCVNKNYKKVLPHSPLNEFLDPARKKICLLDDNFLGCADWKQLLEELKATKKPFQFRQGLDVRILTDEKCEALFTSKYDDGFIFAFDNIADASLIEKKLQLIRKYTNQVIRFYVLCGFDRGEKYDNAFWRQDIIDMFNRIKILMRYRCVPYIMRFEKYKESPNRGIYITAARWCNQPSMFKKLSFQEFCNMRSDSERYLREFIVGNKDIADEFFKMKYQDIGT